MGRGLARREVGECERCGGRPGRPVRNGLFPWLWGVRAGLHHSGARLGLQGP